MSAYGWLHALRKWLQDPVAQGRSPGRHRRYFRPLCRPNLEQLEARVVPATALSISDAILVEGSAGTRDMVFTVSRSGDLTSTLVVGYTTADATATAGNDFTARTDTITLAAGSSTATISIPILGDTLSEPDETFTVRLTGIINQIGPTPTFAPRGRYRMANSLGAIGVASADLNLDGLPDLITANRTTHTIAVLRNMTTPGVGTPNFSPYPLVFATASNPLGVASGDFNGDGRPDVATANYGGNSVSVLLNTTPGSTSNITFANRLDLLMPSGPTGIAVGDINGDARPDLVVVSAAGASASVLLNTTPLTATTASFAPRVDLPLGVFAKSVALADFNRDGRLDFAAVGAGATGGAAAVFLNATMLGSLTPAFSPRQDFPVGSNPISAAVGDINLDGKPDLVVSNAGSGSLSVLVNTAAPGAALPAFAPRQDFATPSQPGSSAAGVVLADVNLDGKLDLAVANDSVPNGGVAVLVNATIPGSAAASFRSPQLLGAGSHATGVTSADFNLDGRPDLAVLGNSSAPIAPAQFNLLPLLPEEPQSDATGVSADGSVVVGSVVRPGGIEAYRWTAATGVVRLGDLPGGSQTSTAATVSADGLTVVGNSFSAQGQEAFRWTAATGMVGMGDFPGGVFLSQAHAVSADGSVIVGLGAPTGPYTQAFRWTAATGLVELGALTGPAVIAGHARGVSADGSVIAGLYNTGAGNVPFRWTSATGMVLLDPAASSGHFASNVSADGSFIAGGDYVAFRWSAATGTVPLGHVNPLHGSTSEAGGMSADGSIIVGNTSTFGPGFVWDWANGMRSFQEVLLEQGVDLNPSARLTIFDVSGDGRTVVGRADTPGSQAFVARFDPTYTTTHVTVLLNTTSQFTTPLLPDLVRTPFPVLPAPLAATTADLNLDGKPDLVVASRDAGQVSVMLNSTPPGTSPPTFLPRQDVNVGAEPYSVVAGDFNRDGKPDLAVANRNLGTITLLVNTTAPGASSVSFAAPISLPAGGLARSLAVADINGDGSADLVVANEAPFNQVSILLNTSAPGSAVPTFAPRQSVTGLSNPVSVATGDLGRDGRPEIVVATAGVSSVSVLQNSTPIGSSTISFAPGTASTEGPPTWVAVGDITGDGWADVAALQAQLGIATVFPNPEYRYQTGVSAGPMPQSVVVGDLNGDGLAEVITSIGSPTNPAIGVSRNTTGYLAPMPSFASRQDFPAGVGGGTLSLDDLNGDGVRDIVVADSGSATVSVLLNTPVVFTRSQATGTILDDDPAALLVTAFTPTSSGFVVQFNTACDAAALNLYEVEGGLFGPADATVVGMQGGPVRGSLVVNATANRITFVRTGGRLPPDTYTVFLRSAANGFRVPSGPLLDGNGDGSPGDPYQNSFTVLPSAAVTVSLPDVTRGPGQPVHVPVTSGTLPLRLSEGSNVTRVEVTLRYDPQLLTITAFNRGPAVPSGAELTSTSVPGTLTLTLVSPVPLGPGPIDFVLLTAVVPANAPLTAKHVLDLSNVQINGGVILAREDDGIHVVGYLGDTTGNGGYSSLDSHRALRVAVGLDSGFAAYQLADPLLIADITGDGALNATDATRILQEAVGLDQPAIPPLPPSPPTIIPGGPDPLLNLPRNLRGQRGHLITVPVNLDPSDGLESVDLAITYNTSGLEVLEVRRGHLTSDFDIAAVNLDGQAGTIRVGLAHSGGPISGRGSGSVVEIVFRVRKDAPAGRTIINLRRSLGTTTTQLNEGGLDLNPDPSDEEGDLLDGLIDVREKARRIDDFFRRSRSGAVERNSFRSARTE